MSRVSIGLPVYNGERFLKEALDSLLAQTFGDFELIISDNASTDRTEEICREYASKDARIGYYRFQKNFGAARNFNRVFQLSKSDYFKWATADDICAPEHVKKCVEVLDRESAAVLCYPRTTLIDEHGNVARQYDENLDLRFPSAKERFRQFKRRVGLCNVHYGLIRSSLLRQTALMGAYPGSDIVLLAELTLYGQFFEIPDYLFFRRFHPQASSSDPSVEKQQEFYDPKTKGKISMRVWRHHFQYLVSIMRAPLHSSEKAQLVYMVFRWGVTRRERLIKETLGALGVMARKILST